MANLKEAQEKGVILGLREISGIIPRVDIDVLLAKEPDTFNLFILAIDKIQLNGDPAKDTEAGWMEKMGYFQVAGLFPITINTAALTG
jgi:tyrosinase